MKDLSAITEMAPARPARQEPAVDVSGLTDRLDATGPYRYRVQRDCQVCHFPLIEGERKVHRGACAHKRELQLQRERRRRARR